MDSFAGVHCATIKRLLAESYASGRSDPLRTVAAADVALVTVCGAISYYETERERERER